MDSSRPNTPEMDTPQVIHGKDPQRPPRTATPVPHCFSRPVPVMRLENQTTRGAEGGGGQPMTPANRKRARVAQEEGESSMFLKEHEDFVSHSFFADGVKIEGLVCRYCACAVSTRGKDILEHLGTKRHRMQKEMGLRNQDLLEINSDSDCEPNEGPSSIQSLGAGLDLIHEDFADFEVHGDGAEEVAAPAPMTIAGSSRNFNQENGVDILDSLSLAETEQLDSSVTGGGYDASQSSNVSDTFSTSVEPPSTPSTFRMEEMRASTLTNQDLYNRCVEHLYAQDAMMMRRQQQQQQNNNNIGNYVQGLGPRQSQPVNPPAHHQAQPPWFNPNTQNSGGDTYRVRWNNFEYNKMSMFSKFLQEGHFVDVTLWCEGSAIKCHKIVLAANSKYFERVFLHQDIPHPIICLTQIPLFAVKALVDYMYKGEANVLETQVNGVLQAGRTLEVRGLVES